MGFNQGLALSLSALLCMLCVCVHTHIYMKYTCQNDESNFRCHVYAIFSEKKEENVLLFHFKQRVLLD